MHRPGYVQGGQEAKCGYLLLGVYYRRIPGDTALYYVSPALPEKSAKIDNLSTQSKLSVRASSAEYTHGEIWCEDVYRFKIVGIWSQWDIKLPMYRRFWRFARFFFSFWANYFLGHFVGYFEGSSTFLTPQKFLEMAHKVICPQKKLSPAFSKSAVHL